jgi:hypothetical protein
MPMMNRQHQPSFYVIWILLAVAVIVFSPAIYKVIGEQHWFGLEEKPIKPNPATTVWVDKQTGFYYCPGSSLYGKASPGLSIGQGRALAQGYRPAEGIFCR